MHNLNDLWYFAAVVRHGGFSAAARQLKVAKSMLSRRVRRLEDELGVRLLERTTHVFEVTDVGQRFYQRCEAAILEMEAAEEIAASMTAEPRGSITVTCLPGAVAEVVGLAIPPFLEAYPKVRVRLLVSTHRFDLVADRIDVAIRGDLGEPAKSDLIVKRIGRTPFSLVASPEFAERMGLPESPSELADYPTLGHDAYASEETWNLIGPDGAEYAVEVHPCVASNDNAVLRHVALGGRGIVFLPDAMTRSEINSGRLIRVLPGWHGTEGVLYMAFPSRRGMLPAVRAFIDFTHARLQQTLREYHRELEREEEDRNRGG